MKQIEKSTNIFVFRWLYEQDNDYYSELIVQGEKLLIGIEGEIEMKGTTKDDVICKKIIESKNGVTIYGDFYGNFAFDVKITQKGSEMAAIFKVDDINYCMDRIQKFKNSDGKEPLHYPGILKIGSV